MTAIQISPEATGQGRADRPPLPLLHIDRKGLVALTIQDLIGQSVNIIGLKRSGKTNTGTVLVEVWLDHGLPLSVIDRQNEYWPLAEHYPCIIAGRGHRAVVQLDVEHAADLASFSFTHKVSVILCLLKYDDEERWAILQAYFTRLYELAEAAFDSEQPEPYAVVLEEARTYLPLMAKTPVKPILREIALGGGKFGLTTVLLNQRAAGTDTDVFSQGSLYFLHKVAHPRDKILYKDIVPLPPRQVEQMIDSLGTGEAIVIHDSRVVVTAIREQRTYHAGATPQYKASSGTPPCSLDPALLEQVQAMMARTPSGEPVPEELPQPFQQAHTSLSDGADVRAALACAYAPMYDHRQPMHMRMVEQTRTIIPPTSRKEYPMNLSTDVISRPSHTLSDVDGGEHAFEVSENVLLLDGQPVIKVHVREWEGVVDLLPQDRAEPMTFRLGALWYALAGAERMPTPEDAGSLLAHLFVLWGSLAQISTALRIALPLTLPQFRLDDWTEEALARYQGTEAELQALSCVLRVPVQTVITWLGQRGKPIPVLTALSNGHGQHAEEAQALSANLAVFQKGSAHAAENGLAAPTDHPAGSLGKGEQRAAAGTLNWKPQMVKDLTEAFLSSREPSIGAAARAIAQQFGWPAGKVEYKIHHLHLEEQRTNRSHLEKGDDDDTQEADQLG